MQTFTKGNRTVLLEERTTESGSTLYVVTSTLHLPGGPPTSIRYPFKSRPQAEKKMEDIKLSMAL